MGEYPLIRAHRHFAYIAFAKCRKPDSEFGIHNATRVLSIFLGTWTVRGTYDARAKAIGQKVMIRIDVRYNAVQLLGRVW